MEFKGVINVQSSGSITWGHDQKLQVKKKHSGSRESVISIYIEILVDVDF